MLFPEWKCSFNKRKALFTVFLKCRFKYCPIAWMFYSRHTSNKVNRLHETLRENCPNTEFFSGPYFPAFGLNMERYGVFSPNAGKYGPGKFSYLDTFQAVREPFRIVYDDDISTFDQLLAMNKSFCIHHLNIEGHLIEIYKTLHEIIGNNLKEFTA